MRRSPLHENERRHLLAAIEIAGRARANGNHPFGALLADADGSVVLEAENTVVTDSDATGHAETNLVRLASRSLSPQQLAGATLFTSTEPCAMCSGAIYWSGIRRVVYALGEDELRELARAGGNTALLALPSRQVLAAGSPVVEVSGPHPFEQAAAVHAGFWD
ncbi:nucleoside deaminase [Streptomyces lydicus]